MYLGGEHGSARTPIRYGQVDDVDDPAFKLVADWADDRARYRIYAEAPRGEEYDARVLIETRGEGFNSGRGQATRTYRLPLEVSDGYESNPRGRVATGSAPVGTDRVELRSGGRVIATALPYSHEDLGAAFFIVPVPNGSPALDEAVAFGAKGEVLARERLTPPPPMPAR